MLRVRFVFVCLMCVLLCNFCVSAVYLNYETFLKRNYTLKGAHIFRVRGCSTGMVYFNGMCRKIYT
ncbi:uncharacterized protein LOC143191687 isoform X2 [Rhynchophorus ferrugineus]|uniref:uncharacterized protein LOC143191687 isoform X2 n=1 Tax=Rhynchophorus ferrugineus TaxID=354439 RepID=UPI003FCD7A16